MKNYKIYRTSIAILLMPLFFLQGCKKHSTAHLGSDTSVLNGSTEKPSKENKEEESEDRAKDPFLGEKSIDGVTYVITNYIDKGSYGEVYKGYEKSSQENYAFKFLNEKTDEEDKVLEEIKAKGGHLNIVKYYGCGEIDGKKCLVLEFIEGELISNIQISNNNILQQQYKEVKDWLGQLPSKPKHENMTGKNVFLTSTIDGQSIIKLIDFSPRGRNTNPTPTEESTIYNYIKEASSVRSIKFYLNGKLKEKTAENIKEIFTAKVDDKENTIQALYKEIKDTQNGIAIQEFLSNKGITLDKDSNLIIKQE